MPVDKRSQLKPTSDTPEFSSCCPDRTENRPAPGRNVDLYTLKELSGHSIIQMTERYAHLQPQKMREAMGKLERADKEPIKTIEELKMIW